MPNHRSELRSRGAVLRRLYSDLSGTAFARIPWNAHVLARQALGSDERIEHWFLAEHFLISWNNWQGRLERFCRYFGQPHDSFPKTWTDLIAKCEGLVFRLGRDEVLDEAIAKSWVDPSIGLNGAVKPRSIDIPSIYTQISRSYERAELMSKAEGVKLRFARKEHSLEQMVSEREVFAMARSVIFEQNERLVELWQELPRSIQDQVWVHLRHYLHSVIGVSWLVDQTDPTSNVSALVGIAWSRKSMSLSLQESASLLRPDSLVSGVVARTLDRIKTTIAEMGYEAVMEDLSSSEMMGGEDSLLASDDVMVVPGHLAGTPRPILLAVTKGWNGKEPRSFTRVIRQVKARLTESNGSIKAVIVFCDCWDSASFEDEQREELRAHAQNGVHFLFVLVGVPDKTLVPIPVEFV
jgi:hypothetical protein